MGNHYTKHDSHSSETSASKHPSTEKPPRPKALVPKFESIPLQLREVPNWVLWRYIWNGRKWTKVPFRADGQRASSTDAKTWCSFDEAVRAYQNGAFDGIGVVVSGVPDANGKVLAAVDIDDVAGNPKRERLARAIIKSMNSYTERSPSGQGYRIFCFAKPLGSGVVWNGVE